MADESFKELLQKLERQHSNEVAILQKEIRDLKAKALVKLEEPKAVLGPKVEAPHSRCVSRENPNQAVPHEVDHRKPAGDLQDVESVDGAETNGNVNRISTSLEVPRTKPPQLHMGTVSSMGTASGSFSVSSPTGEPKDTPEAESKPKEPLGCMGTCEKWVKSDAFELAVAGLVALNFFTMAAEMQYEGLQIGYVLGHRWLTAPASEFWPGAATVFEVFRMVFLVAFSVEILVRVFFLRGQFCKTAFNIIDFSALLASIVELFSLNLPVDPTLLRLCRLAKLFRTIRVLRFSGMLDSLSMLARCMSSSGLTLVWSLVFLLVIQLIAAMMVCLMVKPYLEDASLSANPTFLAEQQAVYRYYGTFSIAVLTLFEVFFANWSPACRVLTDNISEWYSLLFLIYRCAIGFAVINVVNAVFVQQTLQVAKGDEEVLFLEKQKAEEKYFKNVAKIFKKLDTSGDGLLSWSEFNQLLEDPKLRFLLDKLEIAAGDLKVLFDLLDDTGDGEISVQEFIEGVTRFKGAAKSLDVGQLLLRTRRLERSIIAIERCLIPDHHARGSTKERTGTE